MASMSLEHESFHELLDPRVLLLGVIRDADKKPFTAALLTVALKLQ